ncbi:MAG: soluble lytic murein transglycosylase [Acidobacteriota bacterium]|jgi:soluble lytic murein transglycosylase|nr:soluble lytic murein transglycosylase [Acidobacteriota bacterium]
MQRQMRRYCLVMVSLLFSFSHQAADAQSARERHERVRAAIDGSDYSTAITELQSLRSAEPTTFSLNNYDYLLARLSERRGDAATASANYQKVLARNSLLSQYALWHLAQLARATGDLTLEREKLRQLIATAPTSLLRDAAMARLGQSFYESGDYASAIQTLRPRSSANGNSSAREALALIGNAYLKSGQKDAARDAFNKLVTQLPNPSQPDDFALAGVRGLDLLDSGSEEAAQKTAPQLAESEHLRRAQVYNFNRDFTGARRHYQAIVERYGQSANVPEATYMIGRGFYQEGNYTDALTYFQRVTTQYPESANARDALNFSGGAYSRLKRFDEAINAYKSFIEHYGGGANPERPFLNIIDTLRDAGRDADALAWVEQTRAHFKGQVGATLALFSQARIHLSQGAWEAALADFDALRNEQNLGGATTPGSTNQIEVAFMRAYVLEQMGRTDDAVNAYLLIPDGRNEYYGGRATRRLRALATDEKTRASILSRLESFRAEAQKSIAAGQFEDARRAAQTALRLTEDVTLRNELLDIARRAYASLPAYTNSIPTSQLLNVGRQNIITESQVNQNSSPTHQALADELLFLGLYDEGAPELAVSEKAFSEASTVDEKKTTQDTTTNDKSNPPSAAKQTSTPSPSTLSRDAAYTLAVLFKRGDNASHAVRYAEPLWKKVPADYLLELAPREMVELLYPAPYSNALLEFAPPRSVDPRFILSIMRQESRFRPEAKSNAAARGLLQFISSTANTIATQLNLKDFRQDDLYNPRMAVLFGSQYMGNLFRQFPDMPQAVAASYNGGEDNVARWVARAHSNDPDRYVLEIGFTQSKDYVYKVMPNYWVYQMLYTEQLKRR